MRKINIGIIGFGTVGAGVVKLFESNKNLIESKLDVSLDIKMIADRDIVTSRGINVNAEKLTINATEIISDPEIDIVVHLIGGIHPELEFILESIKNKKHVVTANKALLAEHGEEIFNAASKNGVTVGFEASVGGGIPIIKSLREGLAANNIKSILGILNGTTNFILTQMKDQKEQFSDALSEAQKLGYAEANPALDISGADTAHKLAILARLAFGQSVLLKDIYCEGISGVTATDIEYADELGYRVKLLAIAKNDSKGIELRVHPTMLPKNHLLSAVNGVFNAIYVDGDATGPTLYYGKGAGQMPTASAVWSDIMDIISQGDKVSQQFLNFEKNPKNINSQEEIFTKYYLRLAAVDQPGVLSKVSGILGAYKISIASVIQKERAVGDKVPIIILTHEAREADMQKAIGEINNLDVIKEKIILIRVEN